MICMSQGALIRNLIGFFQGFIGAASVYRDYMIYIYIYLFIYFFFIFIFIFIFIYGTPPQLSTPFLLVLCFFLFWYAYF